MEMHSAELELLFSSFSRSCSASLGSIRAFLSHGLRATVVSGSANCRG